MAYGVDLTERAARDLRRIYLTINAEDAAQARAWFNGLEEAISSLDELPASGASTPEDGNLRHLLYGRKRHCYRIIYAIDETQPHRDGAAYPSQRSRCIRAGGNG